MLVRVDASAAIGSGHVMRCLALAKAWQSSGGRVCCLMAETIPALRQRLIAEHVECASLAVEPGTLEDAEQTAAWSRRVDASWVVVDGYRFNRDYVRRLKMSRARLLMLDDDARFNFYEADVVLNQNINARPEQYKRDVSTHLLLGSTYVLLRPEFVAQQRGKAIHGVARKILVTMGGSDSENVTAKVVRSLPLLGDELEATVVVGDGNLHYEQLHAVAEKLPIRVWLERSPANMAPLMSWADVAISAAGGTCWELAYLGIPMILIVVSNDQAANVSALSEHHAAINLGWHANLSEHHISEAIRSLSDGVEMRRAMSERGQRLVDGRGASRV